MDVVVIAFACRPPLILYVRVRLMALWPAILRFAATWAALILRLRPAACDLGSSAHL